MMLKLCFMLATGVSLVSCRNIGSMVQNVRKEGTHLTKIVDIRTGNTITIVGMQAGNTVQIVEKRAGGTKRLVKKRSVDIFDTVGNWIGKEVETIGKEGSKTFNNVGKWVGDEVETIGKEGAETLNIVGKWVGDEVETIGKEGAETLNTVGKWVGDEVETIGKEGAETLNTVGKWVGDEMETIGKEGALILSIVEKGIADTVKTAEDFVMLLNTVKVNPSCHCAIYTCECSLQLVVEKMSVTEIVSLSISYLPDEYGFRFMFTFNKKVLIDYKVSVKNPPPICNSIPYIRQVTSICIRFYNLDYKDLQVSGCARIEIQLEGVVLEKYDFGCIHFPPNNGNFLTKSISQ